MSFTELTHGFAALECMVLDSTIASAQNTRVMLAGLGISQVEIVRTADEALAMLSNRKIDIAILEWKTKQVSGLELVHTIRYTPTIRNATQPILMLMSDPADVPAAINAGVDEVALRPLSPQTLAEHIHTIVQKPKSFILSSKYRGPDRRDPDKTHHLDEKRIQITPQSLYRGDIATFIPADGPRLIVPDFSLRMKVNMAAIEKGLMSPQMLEKQFLNEGLEDVKRISELFNDIESTIGSHTPIERMTSSSTLVQARAEAYEYALCAKVAGYLSDFCRHYFNVHNPMHRTVLEKHIQALQVILHNNVKGDGGKRGNELTTGLSKLVFKFV